MNRITRTRHLTDVEAAEDQKIREMIEKEFPKKEFMIEQRIQVDGETVVRLEKETLTDGSHVYNIYFRETEIPCTDEKSARAVMAGIADLLRGATNSTIEHL